MLALDWDQAASEAALEVEPAHVVSRAAALLGVQVQPGVTDMAEELEAREALASDLACPARYLVRLREGWVEPRMCTAVSAGNNYVFDSVRTYRQAQETGYVFLDATTVDLPPAQSTVELDGPAVLVGVPAPGNFFHWMLEALPRVFLARPHVPADAQVLVPRVAGFAREALLLAGVPEELIFEIPEDTVVRARELFVPPRGLSSSVLISRAAVEGLRSLAPPPERGRRIYVSRSGALKRRVSNEEELAPLLAKYGFESVRTEELTLREQIEMFGAAEVVMCPHGAALTNLAFAQPGTLVIELQPEKLDGARTQLYLNLASVGAQRYIQVVCAAVDAASGDMRVDEDHLDAILEKVAA